MYALIFSKISQLSSQQVSSTGIGLFRIFYGLVCLQEIIFLFYFNHLIFDPIPFIDVEFPTITFFLCLWGAVATCIIIGYRYQLAVTCNYLLWIVFVNFTAMQRDFDGGFDLFMTGAGFFLLFMPGDRTFSIDNLRYKLSTPFLHYNTYSKPTVSALTYYLPVWVCLGFLYIDSDIHKIFAQHWRNGLGAWLPSTQPYYVSALDMSFFLNNEPLQKILGYTIMIFQATFIFFFSTRRLRVLFLLIGIGLHLGITLSLNIYPFGLAMLAFYPLLVPFAWWRRLSGILTAQQPVLIIFYDRQCPLCNRTVLTLNHFDIFKRLDFKNAQDYAANCPALASIEKQMLLTDLYAVNLNNKVYSGLDTYIQICLKMGYLFPVGLILRLPGIYQLASAKYRAIADTRTRITCTAECAPALPLKNNSLYTAWFEHYSTIKPKTFARRLSKVAVALLILQLNCSIHYGLFYRLKIDLYQHPITAVIAKGSSALLMVSRIFLGIAPHALYLHDHFSGYDRILAITYTDKQGNEQWLPFVNQQGRLLAPNWGRVQSMWANIAVTPTIDDQRVRKFIMKVTAFWGDKIGLDLNNAEFQIKLKNINAPNDWVYDQLHKNMASQWVTVGTVQWTAKVIAYNLPYNLNAK
ncbi:DCC1-like thiol-disulfide oxidoreductase family protein [Crenothrix polyspora]|uniref:Thiol-disulfide oxidoreductase DCC n=1 Tax=Crenothrix polyspora TaxID=360316 RepID=A0A1R4GZL1_9GAMM|nr:DCC1-like thiol-disulfide oxidoreductase family protein [Crenothrix polyspora]SJM89443.1 Thiol-disulfide oxidoreductase DCC [Crenothrix polyspora]